MEKVRLPKRVVDSIEFFKELGYNNESLLKVFMLGDVEHCVDGGCLLSFAKSNFTSAFNALLFGYEADSTKEEVEKSVRDYYLGYEKEKMWSACTHIQTTLDLLNIKIEGVNV